MTDFTALNIEAQKLIDAAVAAFKQQLAACQAQLPTPTPTPTPTPVPVGDAFVWNGLNSNWPNARNTGPRIALTDWTAGNTIGSAQTIKGKRFRGMVSVIVDGVNFEDCEFINFRGWGLDANGKRGSLLYCRLVGTGYAHGVLGRYNMTRCDISGVEDGYKPQGDDLEIKFNYLHDPAVGTAYHSDGVQMSGPSRRILLEGNYIVWRDTSCLYAQPEYDAGGCFDIVMTHNYVAGADMPIRFTNKMARGVSGKLIENVIVKGWWGYYDNTDAVVEIRGNINQGGAPITGYKTP